MDAAGDQAGDVCDICDENRADLAGDLRKGVELDRPRDRGAAAEDRLRPFAARQRANLVEVSTSRVAADAVLD
jgi:hypothetical protein